ncbi:site-specific integrase [Methanosalsum natronophilum]|uniref:Site-specific integrase n=1 Tax=Methanosalsum natronophilum TaxID=768733 RepID=A0A3R8CDP6_9EURY|nr:MAG: site-specific integrase [Methanosalsum natronophilum]
MTKSVDDVHAIDKCFKSSLDNLKKANISQENKEYLERFVIYCRQQELKKSTITSHISYAKRFLEEMYKLGIEKELPDVDQYDYERVIMHLEDEKGLSKNTIRNYKKFIKKFFRWYTDGEIPKWVKNLKLEDIDSTVQPHELLTQEELDKILDTCTHPRDKALIAVLADGGMRIGALASCRLKHIEFNDYGAMIYISKTSQSRKTTTAKGIPLTWSSGYLSQWYSLHPLKDDPEAPLWVTKNQNREPMSYKSLRMLIKQTAEKSGVKKRVNPHSFRHYAITNWILDGLNEQEVKHRAGWSKGSTQMFKVYANFTDQQINDGIYEKYGLKKDNSRHVTLEKCPRCSNILRSTDKFCSQCSLVLDQDSYKDLEHYERKIPDILQAIMQTEEGRKLFESVKEV